MDITATVSSLGQVYGHHSNCQFIRPGLWASQQLSVPKIRFMDLTTKRLMDIIATISS